jgi:hypothetical protein
VLHIRWSPKPPPGRELQAWAAPPPRLPGTGLETLGAESSARDMGMDKEEMKMKGTKERETVLQMKWDANVSNSISNNNFILPILLIPLINILVVYNFSGPYNPPILVYFKARW